MVRPDADASAIPTRVEGAALATACRPPTSKAAEAQHVARLSTLRRQSIFDLRFDIFNLKICRQRAGATLAETGVVRLTSRKRQTRRQASFCSAVFSGSQVWGATRRSNMCPPGGFSYTTVSARSPLR